MGKTICVTVHVELAPRNEVKRSFTDKIYFTNRLKCLSLFRYFALRAHALFVASNWSGWDLRLSSFSLRICARLRYVLREWSASWNTRAQINKPYQISFLASKCICCCCLPNGVGICCTSRLLESTVICLALRS